MASGQELHFIYQAGSNLPTEPDITFTGASLIKIPILISVYRHLNEEPSEQVQELLNEMIIESLNEATDAVMQVVINPDTAPLAVTQDVRQLGLENTFLGGYFYPGAPLLQAFNSPAGERTDVFTDPDAYNQTTPVDMGMLLADLYQCAEDGGGALVAVYKEQITQAECQDMLNLLSQNRIGVLLEAGVPEGTRVAHKHGWVTNPNTQVINTMSDAGIVFTPTGDYVVVISLYQPVQLVFDPIAAMFSQLSEAIYNYYTLPARDS
jgi:beta-lactamase class A